MIANKLLNQNIIDNGFLTYFFSVNEYHPLSKACVITHDPLFIHPKILQNQVLYFVKPSLETITRYILPYKNAIAIFELELPSYAKLIQHKSEFGNFIVINPQELYANDVWTVAAWYCPYIIKPLEKVIHVKLNNLAMSTCLTFCDPFYYTSSKTIVPVNISNVYDLNIMECKESCKFKPICRYRLLEPYRHTYANCKDYIQHELMNFNRILKRFNSIGLLDGIITHNVKLCSKSIKSLYYRGSNENTT